MTRLASGFTRFSRLAPKNRFLRLMKAETWMDPGEAVAEGLADAVTGPEPKKAQENKVDLTKFIQSMEMIH